MRPRLPTTAPPGSRPLVTKEQVAFFALAPASVPAWPVGEALLGNHGVQPMSVFRAALPVAVGLWKGFGAYIAASYAVAALTLLRHFVRRR